MTHREPCQPCRITGAIVPWALLTAGAVIALLPVSSVGWNKGAAYIVAVALALMALSTAFNFLRNFTR